VKVERKDVIDALRRIRHGGFDSDTKLILSYIDSLEARLRQAPGSKQDLEMYAKKLAKKMGIEFAKIVDQELGKKRRKKRKKRTFGVGKGYK